MLAYAVELLAKYETKQTLRTVPVCMNSLLTKYVNAPEC